MTTNFNLEDHALNAYLKLIGKQLLPFDVCCRHGSRESPERVAFAPGIHRFPFKGES